jgi:hypothetical protein
MREETKKTSEFVSESRFSYSNAFFLCLNFKRLRSFVFFSHCNGGGPVA